MLHKSAVLRSSIYREHVAYFSNKVRPFINTKVMPLYTKLLSCLDEERYIAFDLGQLRRQYEKNDEHVCLVYLDI